MIPQPHPTLADGPPTPFHVAIIMDGNGRWATARGLPRVAGHRQGAEAVRSVVQAAPDLGITHLTLFSFSSENWRRPEAEVAALMALLRLYLRNEVNKLHTQGVCLRFIGDLGRLAPDIRELIEKAACQTIDNSRLFLTIALSYGGRDDILQATKRIAAEVASGGLAVADIDEATLDRHLWTAGLPDPDLLVRTSGEKRMSNFLLWQCAYAEMVFVDTFWPDFDQADLARCVGEYTHRQRRFGAVAP